MKFENKGKWFNESEDTDKDMLNDEQQELAMEDDAGDLLAEDELDLADEDIDDDSEGVFNDEEQVDEACRQKDESAQKNENDAKIENDLLKQAKALAYKPIVDRAIRAGWLEAKPANQFYSEPYFEYDKGKNIYFKDDVPLLISHLKERFARIDESAQKNEDFYRYIDEVPTEEIAGALKELGIKEPYATQKAKIADKLAKRFGLRHVPTPIEMVPILNALPYFKDESSQKNEVRYIDPANLSKYSKDEIEEVTTASGEKRYKRKGGAPVQSTVQTGSPKAQNKQRVIQNVPNIREGLKMLERDSELSKNYSDFGPSNDMNSGNYIAKNNETGRYEVVGHYNTDDTITILANNKKNEATVDSPQQKEQAVQEKNSLISDFIRLKGKRDSLAQENKRIGKQAKDANKYPADAQKKVIGNQKKIDALEKEMSMKKARIDELDKAISSYKDPEQLKLFK